MEVEVQVEHVQDQDPGGSLGAAGGGSRAVFLDKVRDSNDAIKAGQYDLAVQLYTEAIALDPSNHILYSNRSAAFLKLSRADMALKDARHAKKLNPAWPKAYYREGVALQALGKDAESLAALAAGLAHDPKSTQLLNGFIDAVLKSPLKERFGPLYSQLQKMKLDQSPFVIISVVGQELLSAACYAASLVVLESALRIGTCSLKLRGSVFSALSSAHWRQGNLDKAIACMLQDLAIAKSLGDQEGECRAHANLGSAYFSKGNYKEALSHHRFQLVLAMRLKERHTASEALSSLGHVYTAVGDYPNALASHKQCVLLIKQDKDKLREAREIGNVGAVYLAMGDFSSALECHNEHLKLAKQLKDRYEEARAYSNLGSAHHYQRNYDKAIGYHNQVLTIAKELSDRTLEARAFAGLGHAARCQQDYVKAKEFHEMQLDNALQTKDKVAEGRACANMGIIYQSLGEYEVALKLHQAHLKVAKELGDRASQGRAYGNMGNAYSSMGDYEMAVRFHRQELEISREVSDKHSEASTHGNMAVAYQALAMFDKALLHYKLHLKMSRELKDSNSEARALNNLGNFFSKKKEFIQAVPYYEQFLSLSQELHDVKGEGMACHKLGYAHYCLTNYREAIRYYEQDLALAKDIQDKESMGRAYCNLGLAHKALADYPQALECQKYFLAMCQITKNLAAKFCALGNMGDVLVKMNEYEEAAKTFSQQLQVAKVLKDRKLEGTAHGNLGSVHRLLGQYDKSLAYHNQELTIFQEISDAKGECRAHGNLGNVHMSLGHYSNAYRCYEEQLDRARDLKDISGEAHAYGNLGITKMNTGHVEDAIGMFEQQLALLEQLHKSQALLDKGKAYGNLGDCYEALGDFDEAVKCHEQYLAIAQSCNSILDQERAYRGLGNTHRAMGNLQQALVCFEKRLVVAHEMDKPAAKGSAYGELGCLHSILGNFEQAISCLQHQLRLAQEMGDSAGESDAACGLGGVYQQMGEYEKALEYHQIDLRLAEATNNPHGQCRAYGNLGLSQESLGEYDKAVLLQEQHLSIAAQISDKSAKILAYSSLGRIHHAMGNYSKAVQYLQQGLNIAEAVGQREDEAKIRHRLGLALWGHGNLEEAQQQLYRAAELFETIRRETQVSNDYKLSLFDLQTASYQALQRVLVALGRAEEALVVAERGRTRAFVDFLLERQQVEQTDSWYSGLDSTPVTKEHILDIVASQKAAVLYYSIAAGYLYSWLITPQQGIVKFHECSINDLDNGSDPEDSQSIKSFTPSTTSVLDQYVGHVRESLGVEPHLSSSRPSLSRSSVVMSETESEADDLWQQHLEELGGRLNANNDRTGFLRLVNRNHIFNTSSYSINSLFSLGGQSLTNKSNGWHNKAPLQALYELLIAPMEEHLPPTSNKQADSEIVLVLQGDLYLIPFAVLKATQVGPCLYERYNLMAAPSIRAIQASQALSKHNKYNPDCTGAVIVGNPRLPVSVIEQWQWAPLPGAEQECRVVGELLGSKALTAALATKDTVMRSMQQSEVLHFATHISWKLAAIVLSPGEFSAGTTSIHGNLERIDLNESAASDLSMDGPPLSDYLLTAADVLNIKVTAKLVVLSSGHTDDRAGRVNSDGVVGLTRAFLAAGAQCVLFSLWPVPEMAARMLLKTFYVNLLQGNKTTRALGDAMRTVQNSRQFSHPSNWAGWVLVGSDVRLSSKVALMGHSLCELLKTPSRSREAMRVVLHLVEKSLQRIHQGQRNAMYTTQSSIENKVGEVSGWRDLLTSVGFRFEASVNNLPASVFFPVSDPGDRLAQCSASLQALLGLPVPTLSALSKMILYPDVGEAVTALMRDVSKTFGGESGPTQLSIPVRLWQAPGCHEFLASQGFDLLEVGKDEVTVKAGKQANRRSLSFALQALVAVFDTQEAPRALLLDSSSSMESLNSTGSASSTSNMSKGSSPHTSPKSRRKSFFNPAEVCNLPSARSDSLLKPHSLQRLRESDLSLHLAYQSEIKQKYSSAEDTDPQPSDDQANHPPRPQRRNSHHKVAPDYSSDSEDAAPMLSRSATRGSTMSTSSTLTQKSTSSAFKRTRVRGSTTSTRSWASDRTLTGENNSRHNSQERISDVKLEDGHLDDSRDARLRDDGPDGEEDKTVMTEVNIKSVLDPVYISQKILAETTEHRLALEDLQRKSFASMQHQDGYNSDSGLPPSPQHSAQSSIESASSVGKTVPNTCDTKKTVNDEIIEVQLSKLRDDIGSSTTLTLSSSTTSPNPDFQEERHRARDSSATSAFTKTKSKVVTFKDEVEMSETGSGLSVEMSDSQGEQHKSLSPVSKLGHGPTSGFSRYVSPREYKPPPPYSRHKKPAVPDKPSLIPHTPASPDVNIISQSSLNKSFEDSKPWYEDSKDSDSSAFHPSILPPQAWSPDEDLQTSPSLVEEPYTAADQPKYAHTEMGVDVGSVSALHTKDSRNGASQLQPPETSQGGDQPPTQDQHSYKKEVTVPPFSSSTRSSVWVPVKPKTSRPSPIYENINNISLQASTANNISSSDITNPAKMPSVVQRQAFAPYTSRGDLQPKTPQSYPNSDVPNSQNDSHYSRAKHPSPGYKPPAPQSTPSRGGPPSHHYGPLSSQGLPNHYGPQNHHAPQSKHQGPPSFQGPSNHMLPSSRGVPQGTLAYHQDQSLARPEFQRSAFARPDQNDSLDTDQMRIRQISMKMYGERASQRSMENYRMTQMNSSQPDNTPSWQSSQC